MNANSIADIKAGGYKCEMLCTVHASLLARHSYLIWLPAHTHTHTHTHTLSHTQHTHTHWHTHSLMLTTYTYYSASSPKDKLSEAFTAEQQQQQQQQQQQDNQSGHHSGGSPTSDQGSLGGYSSAGTETVTAQPDYNAHTIFRSQEK